MEAAQFTGTNLQSEWLRSAADGVKLDHSYARHCSISRSLKQMHSIEKSHSKGGGLVYGKYNLSSLHINTL